MQIWLKNISETDLHFFCILINPMNNPVFPTNNQLLLFVTIINQSLVVRLDISKIFNYAWHEGFPFLGK